jgi:hypothetical protein
MTQPMIETTPAPPPESREARAARKEKKKEKNRKKSERQRSLQTMFRIAYQNHIALSQMADQKFGMLINVNGLIMSVVLALFTARFAAWSWLSAPGAALGLGSLVSLAFAVLGARPRFERSPITIEDVRNNRGNVLFFGQFRTMPLTDFQAAIRELSGHQSRISDALAMQLYAMGGPLTKKYRYLRIAYTAFLTGVLVSAVLFVAVLIAGR